jgi:RNA polymerase sigma-70 factor (ECF subfamily)
MVLLFNALNALPPLIDEPTPDELLEHRSFVASLARHLTSDEDAARDLAQDVWVETIQRPPRHDKNLRGWFRQVARRSVIRGWRRTELQRETERQVARQDREEATDTPELSAFPDIAREILALDDPYRSVVLLRYYEDLGPGEISERLGRPLNTVKSQLRRALERLRERLDGRYGDRSTWSLVLLAEALRLGVPKAPPKAQPLPAAAAVPSVTWAGVFLRVAVGAIALTVLVGGVFFLRPTEDVGAAVGPGEALAAAGLEPVSGVLSPVPAAGERSAAIVEQRGMPAAAPDALTEVVVTVVDSAGEPIVGASVLVTSGAGTRAATSVERGRTGADGRYTLNVASDDRAQLTNNESLDGRVELIVRAEERPTTGKHYVDVGEGSGAVTVRMRDEAVSLSGRIVDRDGVPIAGAQIVVPPRTRRRAHQEDGAIVVPGRSHAATDTAGRFSLTGIEPGERYAFVQASGFVPGRFEVGSKNVDTVLVELTRGGVVTGTITDGRGAPIAGAKVWLDTAQVARRRTFGTDEAGVFRIEGVPLGAQVLQAAHPDDARRRATRAVTVGGTDEIIWDAQLRERDGLQLELVDEHGAPVHGAVVHVIDELGELDEPGGRRRVRELHSDAEGRATTHDLLDGSFDVRVYESVWNVDEAGYPLVALEDVGPSPGVRRVTVPGLDALRASLRGTVVDAAGAPLTSGRLVLHAIETDHERRLQLGATEGAFEFDRLPRGTYRCTLMRPDAPDAVLGEYTLAAGNTLVLGALWAPPITAQEEPRPLPRSGGTSFPR